MARKKATASDRQMMLFEQQAGKFVQATRAAVDSIHQPRPKPAETELELGYRIIGAAKTAIAASNLSYDQVTDRINRFLHRSKDGAAADPATCKNPLSKDMLYQYLSKPLEYPIPAIVLYAIMHVTSHLAPAAMFAESMGGRVASREEIRLMVLGQIQRQQTELKRYEKLLRET